MVKSENFITIQGWMVSELGLSRNELLCYALIYGFCQDGQSFFSGTSAYIAEWLNIDKRNVLDVLKRLCDKGLIVKVEKVVNGVKLCDYKTSGVVMKHHRGGDETSLGGGDETSPHIYNKDIYKDNNIINKKVFIDEYFNFGDCEDVREIANSYPERILNSLHKFLLNTFNGQYVDVAFIEKQAKKYGSDE